MAKIRYRPRDPWKILIKFLNRYPSVLESRIEKHLYNNCHSFQMKMHLRILIELRFCERKKCVNQNNVKTTKIIVKRRIPKKLTLEFANDMIAKPWLAWFAFPE